MSEKNSASIVRFGDFEFDPRTRELRKFGTRLRIEDKPAQLLCLLVEAAPNLITRTELHARLWPEGVHVDREHGLNKCANQLRLVLGDDPLRPRFIETLRGRGYRFVAELKSKAETPQVLAEELRGEPYPAASQTPLPVPRIQSRSVVIAATLLLVIAGSAVIRGSRISLLNKTAPNNHPSTSDVSAPTITSVVIGTSGGIDPPDNGFKTHVIGKFHFKPVRNRIKGGVDGIETTTDDQGYFYRPLTASEKEFALQRDWRLICVCALKQGSASSTIDFGREHGVPRFDIELLKEGNRYYVALTKEISPQLVWEQKIEFAGVADVENPHTYELRYDHKARTASLWIDGILTVSNYRGHSQFVEDRGLTFGSFAYLDSDIGVGVFKSVSFEAR